MKTARAIIINNLDNVATLVEDVSQGEPVDCGSQSVQALEAIARGHKIALCALPAGAQIIKYGCPIGIASSAIRKGEWVHIHNIVSQRAGQGETFQEKRE